jgi:hypothetical protein
VLHLTINPRSGSCEHFYHFLLGFLLPLAGYLGHHPPAAGGRVLVRSCGPLDRILHEIAFPGVVVQEREAHAAGRSAWRGTPGVELVETQPFDFANEPPDRIVYDAEGLRAGIEIVRDRLGPAIARIRADLTSRWGEGPRLLVIERADPDPYYNSGRAEIARSGAQRRVIANHAELVAALRARVPGCQNVRLESMPLAAQIAWFELADIVVAQHGAALANVVWMRRGAHVVEIDPQMGSHLFARLAPLAGVSHAFIPQSEGKFGPVSVERVSTLVASLPPSTS